MRGIEFPSFKKRLSRDGWLNRSGYLQRSRARFRRGSLVAAALWAILILLFSHTETYQWLESGAYDARVRWTAQPARADGNIVVIDIDNASFDSLGEKLGRWPWTRRVWTEIVRYVAPGKPRAIVFGSIFGGTETPAVDEEFASVMQAYGNVVLAYAFSQATMDMADTAPLDHKLRLLDREAAPVRGTPVGETISPQDYVLNVSTEQLGRAATGMGCITAIFDSDGKVRSVPLQYIYGQRVLRTLSTRAADLATNRNNDVFQLEHHHASGNYAVRGTQRIPVDDRGRMLLLWKGGSWAHQRIPIWQVICSIYPQQCPEQKVYYPQEFFKDKIVLVGASSFDVHPTPFTDSAPGFVVHATAIDNLLHGESVRPAPEWVLPVAVLAMALTGAAVLLAYASAGLALGTALALLVLYAMGSYVAFARWHFWMPFVAPSLALVLSHVSSATVRYATVGRDLRRTRGTLDRYMSPQLVNYVLENLDSLPLSGKRELTILFSDIRSFTTMTERSDPMELIKLLNEYLTAMTEIIFKHAGIVDKFIGDGILAYWGAFTPGKNHAVLAGRAALEMIQRVEELNKGWTAQGRGPIAIGIGINTGDVVFGNIGSGKKIEFTVIGDPVNLAARLEGLNKDFRTHIVISDFTRQKMGDVARVRPLGPVKVKGKTVEINVFELQGLYEDLPAPARPAIRPSAAPGAPAAEVATGPRDHEC